MHGGQAIPAFDFYLAPFVRSSFVEELENSETLSGEDLSEYKTAVFADYEKKTSATSLVANVSSSTPSTRP